MVVHRGDDAFGRGGDALGRGGDALGRGGVRCRRGDVEAPADVDDVGVVQVGPSGLGDATAGLDDERVEGGVAVGAFGDGGEGVAGLDGVLAHPLGRGGVRQA